MEFSEDVRRARIQGSLKPPDKEAETGCHVEAGQDGRQGRTSNAQSGQSAMPFNQEPVELAALGARLAALHRTAYGAHFFVRGDRDLAYQEVAQVIDMARGAGWNQIGLMTR